jgi:hypothetical protein
VSLGVSVECREVENLAMVTIGALKSDVACALRIQEK